jgi:anti-sigma factor RsiW
VSGSILRLGGDEHDIVQLLLPWLDGGHLDDAEATRVNAHLGACARCQADLAWQRRLRSVADGVTLTASSSDADRGWSALRGRLGAAAAGGGRPFKPLPAAPRARPHGWTGWRWVMALQSAVIVGLAALVVAMLPRDDAYRALGTPGRSNEASIVVVFRPDASELQIRQALRDSDARLVDGPTATGAYLLSAAPAKHANAIERLRRQGAVLRVESLDAGPVR